MSAEPSIELGLTEIRRRRRRVWLLLAAYLPVVAALIFVGKRLGLDGPYLGGSIALSYMVGFAFAVARLEKLPCPRCRERFHRRRMLHNAWTAKCLHCGLPLRS